MTRTPRSLLVARRLAWLASGSLAAACAPQTVAPPAAAPPATVGSAVVGPPVVTGPPAAPMTPEQRAEDLVAKMTLDEKIDFVGGDRDFYIRAIPRLGIPEIKMSDGPVGCRNWGPSTAYPAAVAYAAAFDPGLAERIGRAIGRDCRARGVRIWLAPGVNIARSPLGGRNFEYMGEDPYLAGKTAAGIIQGVQAEGVIATVKHFAANNQEWDRRHTSSEVSERALREIYFPAFERAVREAHVGAVMTAYNLLNGVNCSENTWLLQEVLKKQWGFAGIVMSDWHAASDTLGDANGGLDLEMPKGRFMTRETLEPLIALHKVDVSAIDEKVRRILRTVAGAGFLDSAPKRDDIPLDDPTSAAVALEGAEKSLVLLKNAGGLLPLDRAKIKRIAVIGPNATPAVFAGSGSAFVTPFHSVGVLDGVIRAAGGIEVDTHPGVRQDLPVEGPVPSPSPPFEGGAEVSAIARRADVVIVSVGFGQTADTNTSRKAFAAFWPPPWARKAGLVEAEDTDRPFALPAAQLETIRLALAANPRTIVVMNAGGAVDLSSFGDAVPALLWAWYPGQEGGRAVANVLFGDVNPSGRLPVTFAKRYADYPSAPYYNVNDAHKTPYTEGVFVGYRGFDAHHVAPAFPFGFGLSYATFEHSDLRAAVAPDGSATVLVKVTNRGKRAGDEIVQIYVAPPQPNGERPPKELKGFARVSLAPGESHDIALTLEPRAFAFWDDPAKRWSVAAGNYEILEAASATDIRARRTIEVPARVISP